MKILKRILLVLLIIAIPLIIGMFLSKDFSIEREVTVNKPKQQVFDYIKYLKNQDHYSKWNMIDPAMKKTYSGTDGTVGFKSSWDSEDENVGKGDQAIAGIREGERMDFGLQFYRPWKSKATAYMTTEALGENMTKVKWGYVGKVPYTMTLFVNMDKGLGDALQEGLNNLKNVLEKQ